MNATTTTPKQRAIYLPTRHDNLRRNSNTGMYCLWFKYKGTRYQPVLDTTDEKLAVERRDAKVKEIKKRVDEGGPVIAGKLTFGELLDTYVKHSEARQHLLTSERISPASYESILSGTRRVKADHADWIDRDAAKMPYKEFGDYSMALSKEGLSASRFNKIIDVIKNAYEYGVSEYLISFNPTKNLKRAVQPQVKSGKILSNEQYAAVLAHVTRPESCNKWKYRIGEMVEFLNYFGTRVGTARQILKSDVQLEGRKIIIRANISKNAKHDYWIPICDAAVPLIKKMLAHNQPKREKYLLAVQECNKTLRAAYKALNLQVTSPHHVFRHMAATRWIEAGCNLKDVSYWLGHADSVITQEVYQHVRTEAAEAEARKLNKPTAPASPQPFTPEQIAAAIDYLNSQNKIVPLPTAA